MKISDCIYLFIFDLKQKLFNYNYVFFFSLLFSNTISLKLRKIIVLGHGFYVQN